MVHRIPNFKDRIVENSIHLKNLKIFWMTWRFHWLGLWPKIEVLTWSFICRTYNGSSLSNVWQYGVNLEVPLCLLYRRTSYIFSNIHHWFCLLLDIFKFYKSRIHCYYLKPWFEDFVYYHYGLTISLTPEHFINPWTMIISNSKY